ncbi:MAG TPA: hypothetical protein VFY84_18885 [Jiangellales bacterium]|nr:hypothetical protein [Jiangellales bacterium]
MCSELGRGFDVGGASRSGAAAVPTRLYAPADDPQPRLRQPDISKASQAREVIAFCDHWKTVTGADPAMLVMDQKVTTQQVLGELDTRGVKFLTLRMRSLAPAPAQQQPAAAGLQTITLDRAGPHNKPRVHEDPP